MLPGTVTKMGAHTGKRIAHDTSAGYACARIVSPVDLCQSRSTILRISKEIKCFSLLFECDPD